jgi:hypothetical protein
MEEKQGARGTAIDIVNEGCHELRCDYCQAASPVLFGGRVEVAEARFVDGLGWRRLPGKRWCCPRCRTIEEWW